MNTEDTEYYLARAHEEFAKAANSDDVLIAAIHEQIGRRYIAWSQGLDIDGDVSEAGNPSNDDVVGEDNFHQIPQSGQA